MHRKQLNRQSQVTGCCILVFVVVLLVVLIFFGAICSILFEHVFTKWDINNPHVNREFIGWQEISLLEDSKEHGTFCIPADWALLSKDGIYTILDSTGAVWAIGTLFYGNDKDYFDSEEAFVETFAKIFPDELFYHPYPDFVAMKGGNLSRVLIRYGENNEIYDCIELLNPSVTVRHRIVFYIFPNLTESPDDFDVAEAIIYSFAYPKAVQKTD